MSIMTMLNSFSYAIVKGTIILLLRHLCALKSKMASKKVKRHLVSRQAINSGQLPIEKASSFGTTGDEGDGKLELSLTFRTVGMVSI